MKDMPCWSVHYTMHSRLSVFEYSEKCFEIKCISIITTFFGAGDCGLYSYYVYYTRRGQGHSQGFACLSLMLECWSLSYPLQAALTPVQTSYENDVDKCVDDESNVTESHTDSDVARVSEISDRWPRTRAAWWKIDKARETGELPWSKREVGQDVKTRVVPVIIGELGAVTPKLEEWHQKIPHSRPDCSARNM